MHGRYCDAVRRSNYNAAASVASEDPPVPSVLYDDNNHGGPFYLAQSLPPSTPRPRVCQVGPLDLPRSYRLIPPPHVDMVGHTPTVATRR